MAAASTSTTAPVRDGAAVRIPVRVHQRRAVVLVALALFQFWLWGTRIWNLLGTAGDFSTAFVTVHLVLYTAAIGAGVVLLVLGTRLWREARQARDAAAAAPA